MTGAMLAGAFLAGGALVSGVSAAAAGMGGMHDHMAAMAHMNAALDSVGATPDQKSKIETLLHSGLEPLMGAHGGMGELHGDLIRLLTAPTIDRGAIEQMRSAEVAKLDQASRTATQALADAAEVLSPDQRARLAKLVAEHHPAP